jgi:hypothetical protein
MQCTSSAQYSEYQANNQAEELVMQFNFETHVLLLAFDSLFEQFITLTNSVGCPIYLECSTLTLFEEFTSNGLTAGDSYSAAGSSSSWRVSGWPCGTSCEILLFWRCWGSRWRWRRFLHYLTVFRSLIDTILLKVFNHCLLHDTLDKTRQEAVDHMERWYSREIKITAFHHFLSTFTGTC